MTTMTRTMPMRAAGLALVGGLALLAACEARMPTAAEVEEMDAASAEARAEELGLYTAEPGNVTFYVDGEQVSAEVARAVPADEVAEIEVVRGAAGGTGVIRLTTVNGEGAEAARRTIRLRGERMTLDPGASFSGLLMIDGVAVEKAALRDLDPSQIESIEVIKGPAAVLQHDDPRAEDGVILITTKAAAGGR